MEHPTPQRSLRSERIARTPYSRPEGSRLKKSASSTPFATVKNIFSYALSPIFRSRSNEMTLPTTTSDLPVEIEQRSESGSEDEWTGAPPGVLNRPDVFAIAAAEGRDAQGVEENTAEWRAKGEMPGGRRGASRRQLNASQGILLPRSRAADSPTPIMNGHAIRTKPSTSSLKRPHTPPTSADPSTTKAPFPSFLPTASHPNPTPATVDSSPPAASSAALSAFLDAKKGQAMTREDLDLIDHLTRKIRSETEGVKPVGWSAAMVPRSTKPYPSSHMTNDESSPNLNGSVTSMPLDPPGNAFSLGVGSPLPSRKSNAYRQYYFGPGYNARRILGKKSTGGPSLKPLFNWNFEAENEETQTKRRKVEIPVSDIMNGLDVAMTPNGEGSIPHLDNGKIIQSTPDKANGVTTPPNDAVAKGKKRAAEIMMELIDEDQKKYGPKTTEPDFIIFNPYDKTSTPGSTTIPSPTTMTPNSKTNTPRSARVENRKWRLRSEITDPPTRGVAAKLAATKSAPRKLTALEKLMGVKSWELPDSEKPKSVSPRKTVRIETPSAGGDRMKVDNTIEVSLSKPVTSQPPSAAETSLSVEPRGPGAVDKASTKEDASAFTPFQVPTLDIRRPSPLASPKPTPSTPVDLTASTTYTPAESSKKDAAPKFKLTPHVRTVLPDEEEEPLSVRFASPAPRPRFDASAIYFTATETALNVPKTVLPFFTFTVPSIHSALESDRIVAAKTAALDAPLQSYHFDLSASSSTTGTSSTSASSSDVEWKCDLCMLKNPASAKDKCTICDAPRPATTQQPSSGASAPLSTTTAGARPSSMGAVSNPNAAVAGEWTCGLCMLKNPDSAKDKCGICEAPRP